MDCPEGTSFWIHEKYESSSDTSYAALAHGAEQAIENGVIKNNWIRMKAANPHMNWDTTDPQNTKFGLGTTACDAYSSPLVTNVNPASTSTCGVRKEHCSVAIDNSV